jgi:sugar phosphate isomerase/epimerase
MIKIGTTYLYTIMKYGYPPKPDDDFRAFEEIAKMGFHYLEMEGLGSIHGENVYRNRNAYQKALADAGIHVHNFCIVNPDLVSLDEGKRKAAYEEFRRFAEIGALLDAETYHLASYAPPVVFEGKVPYQLDGGHHEFADQLSLHIPDGFSWKRVWEVLVESAAFCADVAKEYDKIILMEPRVGEIICSVDSMIRLLDDAGRDNLKANFDTGHFAAQRENVNLALMKLEGRFANIHIADHDGATVEHLSVGDGIIDWAEFFRLLKVMNYDGYVGLDLGRNDLEKNLIRSREFIRQVATAAGHTVMA